MAKSAGRTVTGSKSQGLESESAEDVLAIGKRLTAAEPSQIDPSRLVRVANQLVAIYDFVFNEQALRDEAADIVAKLAMRNSDVLDIVFANAKHYAETQYIDDASPYEPNSFDVLSKLGRGNQRVISFLKGIVRNEWGIPRWKAIGVLCSLQDPDADRVLREIVRGKYPPKFLEPAADLRAMSYSIRGKRIVAQETEKL